MRVTITDWIHSVLKSYIQEGNQCIDATMGKGNDTKFMCEQVRRTGSVFAFDIQPSAIDATNQLLEKNGHKAQLILDGHEHMDQYCDLESIDCIMFNLGYLPGGDHKISTKVNTTKEALDKALNILKSGGILSICIYSGGDSGFEERDAVMEYLKALDDRKYFVTVGMFPNKENNPPIPVFIIKL